MQTLTTILVSLVALEHLYILYMEMFAWETLGKKTFKGSLPDELFKPTKNWQPTKDYTMVFYPQD
jgi:putative membrane protein